MNIEEKIKIKARNCLNGLMERHNSSGGFSKENIETYLNDIAGAMKILEGTARSMGIEVQ